MNVSFGNNPDDGATQVVPETQTIDPTKLTSGGTVYQPGETVPVGVPAVVPANGVPATSGFLLGDKLPGFDEIKLPRINIVQGIGELKDTFPQGAIVFNQSLVIYQPPVIEKATGNVKVAGTPPVNITVLGFRPTRFAEKVQGGRGVIVNTEDEVRSQGGTTDYNEAKLKAASGMRLFEPLADAAILIRRPDTIADDDTIFTFEIGEHKYALGMWAMKGTSYTNAAKAVFFTARRTGCLRKAGYPSYSFNLSTRLKPFQNGNSCWIPVCVPHSRNTDEFMSFVADLLNPQTAPAE